MKKFQKMAMIALLAVGMIACDEDDDSTPAPQTITDIAAANPNLSTLVTALQRTGLDDVLDAPGTYTVFAPTNAAFATFLGTTNVNDVPVPALTAILLNHVIGSEIPSSAIPAATYVSTLSPFSSAANAPTINMFVQKSGSVVTLNGGVANGGAVVATADIDASNGIIHVVGSVIDLPTVTNFAVADPSFDTLQAALTTLTPATDFAAILDRTMGGNADGINPPFTVFAPTNDAFTALNTELAPGGIAGLTEATLTNVLLYHVVGGANVRSTALTPNGTTTVNPLLGGGQTFGIILPGTMGNIANVIDSSERTSGIVAVDVQAANGVIHVLNRVLLPGN